jgi:nucleoside-diphosphate-sugar epimerase
VPTLLPDDVALLVGSPQRWRPLEGAHVLLTGGTGFVGRWLLGAFVHANAGHGLRARIDVLTRDSDGFARACPDLAGNDAVTLVTGDVRSADLTPTAYTHVIHGAAPSDAGVNEGRPQEMLDIIEAGTSHMLDVAARSHASRFLLLSSGAVYEPPPPHGGFDEASPRGPQWPAERSAYAAGKRAAEDLTWAAAERGLDVTVARLFAFVGPHLPLDRHFAIGNFIADALAGRTIRVHGDGSPVRSYLYAADMALWLWTMLLHEAAAGAAYNVGSEQPLTIAETARLVAAESGAGAGVVVLGGGGSGAGERYLPSTRRARTDLGLHATVALPDAVRRWLAWHRSVAP